MRCIGVCLHFSLFVVFCHLIYEKNICCNMTKLHVSDVGAFRGSKNKEDMLFIDEGNDGMLLLPENHSTVKNFAVITDGVGGMDGNGMHDIDRFEVLLSYVGNTRADVRKAFYALCGYPSKSTIASLWLPQTFNQKGMILHAGDSHVLRLREKRGYETLEVLTKEHSIWDKFLEHSNPYLRKMRNQLEAVESPGEMDFLTDKNEIIGLIMELEIELGMDYKERFDYDIDDCSLTLLHHVLLYRMRMSKYTFYLYLGDSAEEVRKHIGSGQSVDVRPGDRFVLLTDGIYPDVLYLDEILDVLIKTRDSAKEAARQLVFMSDDTIDPSGKRIKEDDRAALVMDLSVIPAKHPIAGPLKTSLGDEIGRYRRRQVSQ